MARWLSGLSEERKTTVAVFVAALGYFVDIYDLALFNAIRVSSLEGIGLTGDELMVAGIKLLNWQMAGVLLGGLLWGIIGDKRGRVQVLFGSILLYSVGNIGNAFVNSVEAYAVMRFITGFGLAGEVGAGITLVSEIMSRENRGYSTTIVAASGSAGAIAAVLVADLFDWRTAFIVGGTMGLALLALRFSVHESRIFQGIANDARVTRGNFLMLFSTRERTLRYLGCICVAVPTWFIIGLLIVFSPELGRALGLSGEIRLQTAVMCQVVGITVGDLASGVLSQITKNRKRVIAIFLTMCAILSSVTLSAYGVSATFFYVLCLGLGFFMGYWAVFLTTAAEQFGTNLRTTVTSTAPNFVRGSAIPITLFFSFLKPTFGFIGSAWIVGIVCFGLAAISLYHMNETYGVDLDFVEVGGE